MIWRDLLQKTKELLPLPMIRLEYLMESARFIPDSAFYQGIVEIGCHQGGTSIRLGLLAKHHLLQKVSCIDIWEDTGTEQARIEQMNSSVYDVFLANIERCRIMDHVEIIKGDSFSVGQTWDRPISFMILDGSHYYEDVKKDLSVWPKHIVSGGFLFMDDFGPWGDGSGPEGAALEMLDASEFSLVNKGNCYALFRKI